MIDNKTLIEYMIWADTKILQILENLAKPDLEREFSNSANSIFAKLKHLAGEYMGWYYDINKLQLNEEVKKIGTMDCEELINYIYAFHVTWIALLDKSMNEPFIIDEGAFDVSLSLNELIFNLVNHASYHRGQIVSFLRMMDIDARITDFYWFKIAKLPNSPGCIDIPGHTIY